MKKSLIALAVLGAIAGAAQAQSSVTIYGIVDTGVTYANRVLNTDTGNTGNKTGISSGIIQPSRLGFKGTEDLGGGLKAVFQLEAGFNSSNGSLQSGGFSNGSTTGLFNRKSVVGLSGDSWGTVLLGRQADILEDVGQWTSVKDFGSVTGAVGHNFDRTEGTFTQNSIRYNTPNLAGFTASAIYGFGGTAGESAAGQSFGLGGQYANGPLGLFAAYYQSKLGTTPSDTSLSDSNAPVFFGNPGNTALKTGSIGASYQAGPARLYANWSSVRQPLAFSSNSATTGVLQAGSFGIGSFNNSKANIFEIGTDYAVTAPLHLLASLQYSKLTFVDADSDKGKLTQLNLGTDYWLSKRTDVYAFASYLRAKDAVDPGVYGDSTGSDNNQTAISVGIRHKF